jgi:molybdate transport system substrate-binding protein
LIEDGAVRRWESIVKRSARQLVVLLVIGLLVAACGGTVSPPAAPEPPRPATAATPTTPVVPRLSGPLTVFTAASLTEAFTELGKAVEAANPGTTVTFNFGGSPALRTQLREGARADLFAAADEPTMQAARQDGTIAGAPHVFVHNKLVVIVAQPRAADITRLQDLARPGLKLVLAQEGVPVGTYARQALTKMSRDTRFGADFAQKVLGNVVSQEANVRQVLTKVQLGEADAGIVYSSDVTPAVRPQVSVLEISDQINIVAQYPIAPVKGSQNPDGARAFIDYVLSPAGQAILEKWGFSPVGPTSVAVRDQVTLRPGEPAGSALVAGRSTRAAPLSGPIGRLDWSVP